MLRLVKRQYIVVEVVVFGNMPHAVAISAIAKYKELIGRLDGTADNRLYTIRTASLQQDRGIFVRMLRSQFYELATYFLHNVYVIIFIPSAPVHQHGLFYCVCRSQRTGGK